MNLYSIYEYQFNMVFFISIAEFFSRITKTAITFIVYIVTEFEFKNEFIVRSTRLDFFVHASSNINF